jgi:galactokinase
LVADLNNLVSGTEGWHNYVLGVLNELKKLTNKLKGFDCEMESKVPVGSGVSSSAALECGLAFGLNELFQLGLDKWDIIKLSQRAEYNFVGTKCGIMDQFASVMGKEGHVMLLDCKTLDFKYISIAIEPYRLLLLNTNVSHNLATGEYNIRRQQCEKGLDIIQKYFGAEISFRTVTATMLEQCKDEMDEIIYNRCSYVIKENIRVLKAVKALKSNDLRKLGHLMYETHQGLSRKYEVSCPELDFLVDFSKNEATVLGSRMMGGGFGGCTLNIIHKDTIDEFVQKATRAYKKQFGIELSSFQTVPSAGTLIVQNNEI